ncbi:hypothetical protein QN277_012983 [Acacia crassicarpa]|uniref:Uncharacterized protein n=1 Tax=Acacia crassicarpa TaxID=499986 RepID=A0AAE1N2C9_9FABA|nr:hypothetical protein QN277_012983 [Acacia crassicarpa]
MHYRHLLRSHFLQSEQWFMKSLCDFSGYSLLLDTPLMIVGSQLTQNPRSLEQLFSGSSGFQLRCSRIFKF